MKKLFYALTLIILILLSFYSLNSYAETLGSIDVKTDKQVVNAGQELNLTIDFGQTLGAYTFNVEYNNNLFEYKNVNVGTASDNGNKVIATYYDTTGGSNPIDKMLITFKAKSDITTSNSAQFKITATGLANNDASVTYEDITNPITKNVVVEPDYKDYALDFSYEGKIIKNEEKEIKITTKSNMGKYYDHAKLIAQITTPENANAKITGKDSEGREYDLIKDGWRDDGYELGGAVNQVLNFTALFDKSGKYSLTLKLVDKDDADRIISSKDITLNVAETANEEVVKKEENKPSTLPKTGINIYAISYIVLAVIIGIYVFIKNKKFA